MTPESPRGTATVAVAGGKGGCGKTTVALGLGLALADRGRRPLVVDADVDVPDLHIRAGVDLEPGLPALAEGVRLERVERESPRLPGVGVVPAGSTVKCPSGALSRVAGCDRAVLFDCPAGAGPDAAAPLRVADGCVLVTTTATESRQDAAKSAGMAETLGVPILATVRRSACSSTRASASAADRTAPAVAPRRTRSGSTGRVVPVPTVQGRPLADDRVREGLRRVTRAVFGSPTTGGGAGGQHSRSASRRGDGARGWLRTERNL